MTTPFALLIIAWAIGLIVIACLEPRPARPRAQRWPTVEIAGRRYRFQNWEMN